jgi:hypothetical protein
VIIPKQTIAMKLIQLIALFTAFSLVFACDYDSYEDEIALQELEYTNPFVRLESADVGGVRTVTVSDSGQTFTVEIVNPSNAASDLTVEYSLGGTADYGEVYTTDVGSDTGGTISLPFDDGSNTDAVVFETITFTTLVDTLVNGPQTIEVELVDVTSTGGVDYQVGQGPLYRTLEITLVND